MTMSSRDAAPSSQAPYAPPYPIPIAPLLAWPVQPAALFRYLFGYPGFLWPYYSAFSLLGALAYFYLPPQPSEAVSFHIGWIALIALKYAVTISLFAGIPYFCLYVLRTQGAAFKYHPKWPAKDDRRFLFNDQVLDNMFWNYACAVPFATMFEVVGRWLYANGYVKQVTLASDPVYCVALFMALPIWAFAHFWAVHRLIHWPPLYKAVHYLHHKNVNINPWSGLAMHPVESCIFFSGAVLFYVIPAHPLFILFYLNLLVMMTPIDHSGFHRILFGKTKGWDTDFYMHYLHHKYFEVNYAFDTSFPMDIWLGTFHDGTAAGQQALNQRRRAAAVSVPTEEQ